MGGKLSKLKKKELDNLVSKTYFDRKELLLWYKGFNKECPSGKLKEEDFEKIYKNRDFFLSEEASSFAKHVFSVFDTEKKGYINFEDFITSLSCTSRGSIDEKLTWAFRLYDTNGDGLINQEEMLAAIDSVNKMVGNVIWSSNEIEDSPQSRVTKLFEFLNKTKESAISLDEFVSVGKKDPSICQSLSLYDGFI